MITLAAAAARAETANEVLLWVMAFALLSTLTMMAGIAWKANRYRDSGPS